MHRYILQELPLLEKQQTDVKVLGKVVYDHMWAARCDFHCCLGINLGSKENRCLGINLGSKENRFQKCHDRALLRRQSCDLPMPDSGLLARVVEYDRMWAVRCDFRCCLRRNLGSKWRIVVSGEISVQSGESLSRDKCRCKGESFSEMSSIELRNVETNFSPSIKDWRPL
jgi:hypothetical protein